MWYGYNIPTASTCGGPFTIAEGGYVACCKTNLDVCFHRQGEVQYLENIQYFDIYVCGGHDGALPNIEALVTTTSAMPASKGEAVVRSPTNMAAAKTAAVDFIDLY